MKGETKSILVIVVKWRHRANGLFLGDTKIKRLARLWDIMWHRDIDLLAFEISLVHFINWFNLKLLSLRSIVNITFVHSFNHHFLFKTTPVLKTVMVRSKFVEALWEARDSAITSLSFFFRRWFRTTNWSWRNRSERKHFWHQEIENKAIC